MSEHTWDPATQSLIVTDQSNGVNYTPFVSVLGGGAPIAGFIAEHPDGRKEHIYICPSDDTDDGQACVFFYHDRHRVTGEGAFMHINVFDDRED